MDKTINGLTKAQIAAKIEGDFPTELKKTDPNGFPYFPATAYQDRLNQIVGIFNYDFEIEPHTVVELKGKHYVTTIGRLTIKYDDGTPALIREAEGGTEVIIVKATGMPKELTDNIKSAATDAFKACCRKLGMAEKQLERLKDTGKKNNGNNNRNQNNNTQNQNNGQNAPKPQTVPAEEKEYRVVITDTFADLNGKGFKAPAKDVVTNEVVSLVFWADAIAKVEEKMPMQAFCQSYVNKALTVVAQKSSYNGRGGSEIQLTVKGFANSVTAKSA